MTKSKNSASPEELEGQVAWDEGGGTATLAIPQMRELLDNIKALSQSNEDYRALYGDLPTGGRRDFKDALFRFIFNRPEWALELYNALRGTDHRDPSEIEFTTIGDFLFLGMRNDVSFIIGSEMMLWEHQSTYSPNLPARIIPYLGAAFGKYLRRFPHDYYGTALKPVPVPLCYCFYNGEKKRPPMEVLRLSDAYNMYIRQLTDNGLEWSFPGKDLLGGAVASVEVQVIMVNVNKGGNHGLLDKCRPLKEYSWLVAEVRRNQELYDNLSLAINGALDAMPGDFATRSFLMDHRGEVYNMLYEDFDKQAAWRAGAEDGKEEGIEIGKEEGIEIGREQAHVEIATNLIREGLTSAERISSLVGMPLDEVVRLAGELGATLPLV